MKQLIHLTLLFLFAFYSFNAAAQIFSGTTTAVWKDGFGSGSLQLFPQGSPNITSGYTHKNTSVDCNNWLHIPNSQSYVTVGDIDIPGTQITIEGLFSRDSAFTPEGYTSLNVVSKHWTTSDVNYLLRVDRAQVTTTTGHHMTPDICDLENKKLYHAAMTYDGSTLKFYRNGFLMSQVPCTGTLFQNNYPTTIAATANSPTTNTTLIGYLNEVRIWNVAKTQAELQLYMNSSLPNPTTQPGLLGYYTFETLINKQGNSLYDAVLHGNASINETVPNCNFTIDTCTTIPATADISRIINQYTPVVGFLPCENKLTVEDASEFNAGDTVLLIQMKGAVIDSTNSANFGTITDYKNAGNYEFNYVKAVTGNIVELQNILQRQYDVPLGKVQLIRVPYYQNIVVTDTLTCLPWDGNKGGVLVLNVKDQVDMQSNIDVSGRGFRGGKDPFSNPAQFNCYENEFYYPANPDLASEKGEGIATISVSRSYGKGALANGGGGGNSHNSGGGGGGNAGAGGLGGYQYEGNPCNATVPFDNRGRGGKDLPASNVLNKIFLGGGGGAGQSNNPQAFEGTGGNGAGIVIINAGELKTNNYKITANGLEGKPCGSGGALCHEGMGGGGAGGFCLLNVDRYLDNTQVEVRGGKGADMAAAGFMRVAPGGGGGAGMAWLKQASLPLNVSVTALGGANGVCPGYSNTNWGAEPGLPAVNLFELVMPVDSIPFKPNIDSVIINDSLTSCKTYDFKGNAIVSSSPIQSWQWNFGDNNVASTQNTSHTYTANGTYTVKLVVTDINGCKDSILRQVSVTDCQNGISKIINEYAAVLSIDPCTNRITVDDASPFNTGDTIMIMQMKGAFIESSNSSSFGNISSYNNAGNYELNYVKGKTGNSIELLNTFLKQYDAAAGKVQLIRVPYFQVVTITDTLTCPVWNGSKGGVLVLYSATEVNLDAPIDVSRKGFRGGQVGAGFSCNNTGSWAVGTGTGGTKGEGITEYITGFEAGGARLANGGGGAYAANTGGGGGANFGGGGTGGNQSNTCGSQTQSIGGEAMDYSNSERVFLGGGGGGGQQDDGQPVAAGGTGGGIAIIIAETLNGNNQQILANGESISTLVRDEGGAGGGAGGSILLHVNGYAGNLGIEANGGTGSSNDNQIYSVRCHGPGAGGGGGYVGYKTVTTPPGIFTTYDGGQAGLVLNPASACFNTTHGATNGETGGNNFSLALPISSVPFKKNIDSVKISSSITACKSFNFSGIAFTNTSPVQNWQWNFGDGNTASTQNTTHTYAAGGTYNVKLIVTDINGCQDSASTIINPAGINFDFVLQQDICNPRSVQFTAIGDTTNEIFWSFGDGSFTSNIRNPAHVYADTGFYLVQYSTGNGPCFDTVRKTIFIGYRPDNIILTPDTTICFGSSKLLRSNIDSTLGFCWSPGNFLDDVNLANPTTSTTGSIMYTLLSLSEENNLVVNGDFSNGNTGFISDLVAGAAPLSSGSYLVTNTSLNAGPQTSDCKDHTNGAGNMMVVSSTNTAASLWNQTVTITPNTNYMFSCWIQSVQPFNSTQLQLSINGNVAADNIVPAGNACEWTRYFVAWNSGTNTTASLSISNKANPTGGDFFAIDDISFAGYAIKRDTVIILVDTPLVITRPDTAVCQSVPVQLSTSGAISYSWSPVTGLSNPASSSPDAAPDTTTQYVVTGTNANGCVATDAVLITVKPKPIIVITGDTLVCRNTTVPLFASGGTSYLWSPAATLSNASISNPIATPGNDTVYRVTVTGANNCSSIDSVKITIQQAPVFTVSPDQRTCSGNFAQLAASGGDVYSWSPAAMVSDATISNPVSLSNTTTTYTVTIKESTCNDSVSLSSTVTVLPLPVINAGKSNDIDCATGSANLQATGALQYVWSPPTGLNDINSAAPIASPVSSTLYTVRGTDGNGCSADDAVTVLVDLTNKASYAVPNAFTPNGDGKNDCFGVKYFGPVQEFQLVIFNRWGERVFFSSNASDCWDGTYKGNPSDNGNYIYFIKAKTACGPVERKGNVLLVR